MVLDSMNAIGRILNQRPAFPEKSQRIVPEDRQSIVSQSSLHPAWGLQEPGDALEELTHPPEDPC